MAPILPANDTILKALALPTTMAITMGEIEGVERQLERLEEALDKGLRLIQVRDKGWPTAQRLWFAEAVTRIARQRGAALALVVGVGGLAVAQAIFLRFGTRRAGFSQAGGPVLV